MKMSTILAALAAVLGGSVLCTLGYLIVDGRQTAERQAEGITKRFAELRSDIAKLTDLMSIESPADGGNRRLDVRLFAIRSKLEQADQPVIVVGDSITEGAPLPSSICGHAVVNDGIGGMTAQSYLPLASQFLTNEAAGLIVVALGTNDSTIVSPEWSVVERSYSNLLDLLAQHTPNIVLAGIPPFEMNGALAKGFINQASGDRNDAGIRTIAETRKLSFIDLRHDIHGEGLTRDGIHLNAAGYAQWRDDIVSHIMSSIGCSEARAR
jgi:lysophospholipase L1-like esterase